MFKIGDIVSPKHSCVDLCCTPYLDGAARVMLESEVGMVLQTEDFTQDIDIFSKCYEKPRQIVEVLSQTGYRGWVFSEFLRSVP